MTNTKYRLISEDYKEIFGKKLYRIEALKDFSDVKAGSLGGYIESEDNLSHDGNAWVYDNAMVYGNAIIRDNARIGDKAMTWDNAVICDNGCVGGNAWVSDNARVGGDARVGGNASWLIVGPIGSGDNFTTFFSGKDGIYVSCGCFYGSISEFEEAVEKTHAGTKHEKDYKLAIALAKSRIVTAEANEDEI